MSRQRIDRDLAWGTVLFISAATIYLSLLSKSYVFEGLARAMPIEVDRFRNLFNGNYLLFGFLGWCFHHLLSLVGDLSAVKSLQIMDALIGAAGLWLFSRILRKVGANIGEAVVWAAALGSTLGYWRWSTDAEDYILSTFLLLLNFYFLIDYSQRRRLRPITLGALHALAVGGHIVNAAFAPVVVWFIYIADPEKWRRPVAEYVLSVIAITLLAYAAALMIVQPAGAVEALRWFWGSAASPTGVSFGGGYSAWKFWLWLKTSVHALTSLQPALTNPQGWAVAPTILWLARIIIVFLIGALLANARKLAAAQRDIAVGCALWLAAYALVFTSWQPDTLVYRTTDLPPLCLLLSLAARRLGKTGFGISAALATSLFLGNLGTEILPRSYASNNPDLARMDFVREHTKTDDWITGGGGRDELYLPFFAQRKPLVIDRFRSRPEDFWAFARQASRRKESIYLTSRTLADPFWSDFFARAQIVATISDAGGFTLFRIAVR